MDASERGAMMLVCSVAIGLIGTGLVEMALTLTLDHQNNLPVEILPCVLKSLPTVAGIVILIKARAIAEWVDSLFDNLLGG
jgi:hypothetical protein